MLNEFAQKSDENWRAVVTYLIVPKPTRARQKSNTGTGEGGWGETFATMDGPQLLGLHLQYEAALENGTLNRVYDQVCVRLLLSSRAACCTLYVYCMWTDRALEPRAPQYRPPPPLRSTAKR